MRIATHSLPCPVWASRQTARDYGDVAGTNAAIKHEEEKATKARTIAIKALLNEIVRINDVVQHNLRLTPTKDTVQSILKMSVTAFETAFLFPEPILLDERTSESSELLRCVTTYLAKASSINTFAEIHLRASGFGNSPESRWGRVAAERVVSESQQIPEILEELEKHLRRELAETAA